MFFSIKLRCTPSGLMIDDVRYRQPISMGRPRSFFDAYSPMDLDSSSFLLASIACRLAVPLASFCFALFAR